MHDLRGKHSIISIILPFKNEEDYLGECVDSILNQTYPYWELLLVDDHSSDRSSAMAADYAQNDARIRYFLNPNQGVIEAMKHGYAQSTGSLITRMDGDDVKTPDNLEQLLSKVAPGVLAVGKVRYFRKDGLGLGYEKYEKWVNQLTETDDNFSEVYKECVIPSPTWLVYRKDFESAGCFDSDLYPEDYDLCFRFYKAGLQTKGTNGVIHLWRDHEIRTTRTSPHYADNRFMALKLHYFKEIDFDSSKSLVVWGAGKKGKQVASYWSSEGVPFSWITDNPKKIGHNIYGTDLDNSLGFPLTEKHQIIITVADLDGQKDIAHQLKDSTSSVFWFC